MSSVLRCKAHTTYRAVESDLGAAALDRSLLIVILLELPSMRLLKHAACLDEALVRVQQVGQQHLFLGLLHVRERGALGRGACAFFAQCLARAIGLGGGPGNLRSEEIEVRLRLVGKLLQAAEREQY